MLQARGVAGSATGPPFSLTSAACRWVKFFPSQTAMNKRTLGLRRIEIDWHERHRWCSKLDEWSNVPASAASKISILRLPGTPIGMWFQYEAKAIGSIPIKGGCSALGAMRRLLCHFQMPLEHRHCER
jgi:hypothetical protein